MLKIKNLNINFPLEKNNRTIYAVRNVNLEIKKGEIFVIIGESGSGKSVLGMSILSLLPESAKITGEIFFKEKNLLILNNKKLRKIRGNQIAFVPQSTGLSLNPTMTIGKQLEDIFKEKKSASKKESKEYSLELIHHFNLSSRVYRLYPHQLSGGMKQRVLIALGLAFDPDLLIIDEPTKGLDYELKKDIEKMFQKIKYNNLKISILLITHDLELASNLGDRIGVMYSGHLIEISKTSYFFDQPKHPYSQGLLEASPLRSLTPIGGKIPAMDKILSGCVFAPRCSLLANKKCTIKNPPFFKNNNNKIMCWQYENMKIGKIYDKN